MPRNNNKYAGVREADNGTYFVSTSARTKDGYITYITKRGFANKTEALAYKLAEVQRVQESYKFEQNNQNIKLYDYFELYLEEYSHSVAQTTYNAMKSIVKLYFKEHLPNVEMSKVKPFLFSNFRNKIATSTILNSDNKNYRINALKKVLQSAIDKLYLDNKIGRLCLLELTPVANDGHIPKSDYWEVEEYQAFINSFKEGDKYKLLFMCLFSFGCRIGEFRGLQWKDLNPVNNTIHVHKQVSSKLGKGKWQFIPHTKTKKSRFTKIPTKLVDLLLQFKEANNYTAEDFLFFGNKPISENAIYSQKKKHCELANVKYITNHDFRHTNITYLLDSQADLKIVASQVGHSNVSTTLNIYNHVTNKRKDKLTDILDNMPI